MNLFFDLFFTLCAPYHESDPCTEWAYLHMDCEDWMRRVETEEECTKRELGLLYSSPEALMRGIMNAAGITVNSQTLALLTKLRADRMRRAVTEIRPEILCTLDALREQGHKLCLVSNADVIDTLHWEDSPLASRMDAVVFSHKEHLRKPDAAIYHLAMKHLDAMPYNSIFIGDGGANEHFGAKQVGMGTILSTYLRPRTQAELTALTAVVDHVLTNFAELPVLLHSEHNLSRNL